MYLVSFVIGLIVVISSIFLIRFELNKAVRQQAQLLEQSRIYKGSDLFEMLENLQLSLDEMNQSFYDIADDLEGKYSIHEKEIRDILEKIELIKSETPKSKPEINAVKKQVINMSKQVGQNNVNDGLSLQEIDQSGRNEFVEMHNGKSKKDNNQQDLIETITQLRSQGLSLAQIAKELNMGLGELQLLIAVRK